MTDRLAERVLSLERRLSGLQADLDAAAARVGMIGASPGVRIGRIMGEPQDSDNTFNVIFDDGSYPETAGQQTPNFTGRQLAPRAVVYNLASQKISAGTRVPCWWWSDRWWTWYSVGTSNPQTSIPIMGFDEFWNTEMAYVAENEERVFPWDTDHLRGNIDGVTWHSGEDEGDEDTDAYFIVYPGTYRMEWGFSGYGGRYTAAAESEDPILQAELLTMFMTIQHRPEPLEGEAGDWRHMNSRFNSLTSFGSPGVMWNTASRSCLLEISGNEMLSDRLRMIAKVNSNILGGTGETATFFYAYWHFSKIDI